jgi:hypothetical protein
MNARKQYVRTKTHLAKRYAVILFAMSLAVLGGCANQATGPQGPYPMRRCEAPPAAGENHDLPCVASLFPAGTDIGQRRTAQFPQRYLELYDHHIRDKYCDAWARSSDNEVAESLDTCKRRLEALSHYFNPSGERVGADEIGVALEGGGTKAGSFAMGALAGLHQVGLLRDRITAISSVSGGTYAASYYFNRLFDKMESYDTLAKVFKDPSVPDQWFRSCVPDNYQSKNYFSKLDGIGNYSCHDKSKYNAERLDPGRYEFIRHVWENRDLINGATEGDLDDSWISWKDAGHFGYVLFGSLVTVPVDVTTRTLFRWPGYSAMSDISYSMGLERDYGYSPKEWAEPPNSYFAHVQAMLTDRREKRTLGEFRDRLRETGNPLAVGRGLRVPLWIANTTAPGEIELLSWFRDRPRDPVRQTFELTWNGYGSGVYGYADAPPPSSPKWFQSVPTTMPIVEAVVGSAAFADSDETLLDDPLGRLGAGLAVNILNTPWFVEIPNFNVNDEARFAADVLPWPFYFATTSRYQNNARIHLQDGGNSENSGIFSLLRRGYRKIIYVHGTQDDKAAWQSVCHLKNALEFDGTYDVRSTDLDKLMEARKVVVQAPSGHKFKSYFDGLCSSQIDGTDFAVFGAGAMAAAADPAKPIRGVYCRRLFGKGDDGRCRQAFDDRFNSAHPETFVDPDSQLGQADDSAKRAAEDAFTDWPLEQPIVITVCLAGSHCNDEAHGRISTIIPIVPAISVADFKNQVAMAAGGPLAAAEGAPGSFWGRWCRQRADYLDSVRITGCSDPEGHWVGSGQFEGGMSCIALAHLIDDPCTERWGSGHLRPAFPQDDFIRLTLATSYTTYAAYYDIGRQQVRRTLCHNGVASFGLPADCTERKP